MSVRLFYVDESHDDQKLCLSAISIRHGHWNDCFKLVREMRVELKTKYGLYLRKEIHAHELLAGRGNISTRVVGKWERSRIFFAMLQLVAKLPSVKVFNVCIDKKGTSDPQLLAWDRLINRIERTMRNFEETELSKRSKLVAAVHKSMTASEAKQISDRLLIFRSRAIIISDEGRELEITRALRKMHVHNPIPSRYGVWSDGRGTKNITTDHVIEDPIFKPSHRSFFVQLADCVAFALLKREVPLTCLQHLESKNMELTRCSTTRLLLCASRLPPAKIRWALLENKKGSLVATQAPTVMRR